MFLFFSGFVLLVALFAWAFVALLDAREDLDRCIALLERVINEIDPASVHGDLYGTIEEALGL